MDGGSTRRAVAGLAVAGGVVALVGNLLAPRFSGNDGDNYRTIADSTRFLVAGFIIQAAVIIVTAALVGFTRTFRGTKHEELAYYGRLAVVIGGAIAILQTGTELYGYRQMAKSFAGADDRNIVSAFWATNALDHLNGAMFATWTIVLLGIAPMIIGAIQLRERVVASWLGMTACVGGLVCAVVGIGLLVDSSQSDLDVPFLIGSLLVTLWVIATGVVMWREPTPTQIDLTTPAETSVATPAKTTAKSAAKSTAKRVSTTR
jgi:hypothetical protein